MNKRKMLGEMVVDKGLMTSEQLTQVIQEKPKGKKVGDYLVEKGFITEQKLVELLSQQLGIPQVNLYYYTFDEKLLELITKDFAKKNNIVPLKIESGRLHVAMVDPTDFFTLDNLRIATGMEIEPMIATQESLNKVIAKNYGESLYEEVVDGVADEEVEDEDIKGTEAPIVRLVDQLLSSAVTQGASDIHIDPQEDNLAIRYRVDGVLRTERTLPKKMQYTITSRLKIIANLDITNNRLPQDGRIKTDIDHISIDMRVSTLPTVNGEKIVIRILDLSSTLIDLENSGFSELNLNRFLGEVGKPSGIVLITGPTGSGKSSTLYATLNRLNNEGVNIITVEDPVEYQIKGVNQIQVNSNIGLTFEAGLRSILRQDPDVVMVGEIRDKETVEIAIRASLTGHLVLSTLHTNSTVATISRLLDMGVDPVMLSATINVIVAQRLVRKVCRDCAETVGVTAKERELFNLYGIEDTTVKRGVGCPTCNLTGYKGRLAIHEVLVIDEDIREEILNGSSASKIHEIAKRNKTIYLMEDGLEKVCKGLTTIEELLRVTI